MSLPRVLPQPFVADVGEVLADASTALPAELRRHLDEECGRAYARGHADGLVEGTQAGLAQVEHTIETLRAAIRAETERLAAATAAYDDDVVDLALAIARYVVGGTGPPPVDDLVGGIRAALSELDDTDIQAHVAPEQVDLVQQLLGDAVRVVSDPSVTEGEARLVGRWSVAALGQQHRWSAVREVLDAQS